MSKVLKVFLLQKKQKKEKNEVSIMISVEKVWNHSREAPVSKFLDS
jgi:hypothetical protein